MGGVRGRGGRRPWFLCCENIEWFQVEFFLDSPLKNMIDGNLVFLRPPDDIINKRAYPMLDLMW